MATRDTGGQQKAYAHRARRPTRPQASVHTEVAERHKEMTEDVDSIVG